ncbi:EspA/EspE family type VII secretion system effector [Mycolicibacterium peregrinum]|nr:EspA/EspE family type VII secretion system effector [Mycolicibacterium peregrinum]
MSKWSVIQDLYEGANWLNGAVLEHPPSMDTRDGKDGHVGWGLAGVGADAVGFMHTVAPYMTGAKIAAAAEVPIIQAGLLTMMIMANTCGFGKPDAGGYFDQGSSKYAGLKTEVESAKRPDTWEGDAANEYEARNTEHTKHADELRRLDEMVRDAVKSEAEQNEVTRKMLDRCQTSLGLCIIPAVALNFYLPWGPAASLAFQVASVAATLPPAEWRYLDLIDNSARNATLIRRAGAGYDQVAAQAQF